jgi:hypothetical protein
LYEIAFALMACAGTHGNGVWYQEGYPYRLDLCSTSWEVGVEKEGWSFGYSRLLQTSSDAYALTADEYYDVAQKKCRKHCDRTGYFHTSGKVDGLYLRREWVYHNIVFMLGGYVFIPQHTVRISEFYGTNPDGSKYEHPVSATYENKTEYKFSPSFGVGYRYENLTFMVDYHTSVKSSGDRPKPGGYETLSSLYSGSVVRAKLVVRF